MATWDITPENAVNYSPNGDDIDTFAQKVKAEEEVVYDRLNRLRTNDASPGLNIADVTAYQWHIDTQTNPPTIYIRNAENTNWIKVGTLGDNFGFDAKAIGAIAGSGIPSISAGTFSGRPETSDTNALYFSLDDKILYVYYGGAWEVLLSLNFDDLLRDGDGAINVTATKIAGKKVSTTTGLKNGDGFIYDSTSDSIVNQQIQVKNQNGIIEGSITGNPGSIAGVRIATDDIADGHVLVYRTATNTWQNEAKGAVGAGKSLVIKSGGSTLATYTGDREVTVDPGSASTTADASKPENGAGIWLELLGALTTAGALPARLNYRNPSTGEYDLYHLETEADHVVGLEDFIKNVTSELMSKTFNYRGSVANYAALPASPSVGDVYSVIAGDTARDISPGSCLVWNGSTWESPGGAFNFESPEFTGTPKAPTAAAGTNTTQIATTAFVQSALAAFDRVTSSDLSACAKLASPAFTGSPTAPTPPKGNSSARIATTEFIQATIDALKLSDYATQNYVDNAVAGMALPDLSGYVTRGQLSDYATKIYVDNSVATTTPNLSNYATLNDVASQLAPYATQTYVTNQMANYATKNYVDNSIPSMTNYATKSYADSAVLDV